MRPRLVATDLDGTFLSPDGSVSAENAAAVADAIAAGLPVVFATGRPPRWLQVVADLPISHPIVIASNGAMLWDMGERRALQIDPIDDEVARWTVRTLRKHIPGVHFGIERGLTFGLEPGYQISLRPVDLARDPLYHVAPAEEQLDEPFVKLLVQHIQMTPDELAARAAEIIGGALEITHSMTGQTGLLELSAPGVTKATMLARYAAELGVDQADVAAFGDMPNDRAMLEWVGHPHVMEQSHASLLELPVTRIGSNAESAVGRTIRGWL